jgi:hypothetical protein
MHDDKPEVFLKLLSNVIKQIACYMRNLTLLSPGLPRLWSSAMLCLMVGRMGTDFLDKSSAATF